MDRVGVFIDAGYLFAQGSVLLGGKKLPRGEIALDGAKMIEAKLDIMQHEISEYLRSLEKTLSQ